MSRVSVLMVISSSSRKALGDRSSMDGVSRIGRRATAPACCGKSTPLRDQAARRRTAGLGRPRRGLRPGWHIKTQKAPEQTRELLAAISPPWRTLTVRALVAVAVVFAVVLEYLAANVRIGVAAEVLAALVDGVVLECARSRAVLEGMWRPPMVGLGRSRSGQQRAAHGGQKHQLDRSLHGQVSVKSRRPACAYKWRADEPKKGLVFALANT